MFFQLKLSANFQEGINLILSSRSPCYPHLQHPEMCYILKCRLYYTVYRLRGLVTGAIKRMHKKRFQDHRTHTKPEKSIKKFRHVPLLSFTLSWKQPDLAIRVTRLAVRKFCVKTSECYGGLWHRPYECCYLQHREPDWFMIVILVCPFLGCPLSHTVKTIG